MPNVGFVTHEDFLEHAYPGHPERPERLSAIVDGLEVSRLRDRLVMLPPRDATDEELLRVHEPGLLDLVRDTARRGGGWLDADTYVNGASDAIAAKSAAAVLAATDAVLDGTVDSAFAAVRPPGHHATPSMAMGFCLFNNVAIAAAAALDRGLKRVAIVDWDVHHGNGTQDAFIDESRVLYVSSHAAPFYPGTGHYREIGNGEAAGTNVNIPLPPGSGDASYRAAYEALVVPALQKFGPEVIIVSSGWDAHIRDPLAPMTLTTAGYTDVARLVLEVAAELCGGRVVVALEGGYDTHALAQCSANLCRLLLGDTPVPDALDPESGVEPDATALLVAVKDAVGLS